MSAEQIASEVAAAYREVAAGVGDGDSTAYLIAKPPNPVTPWDSGYYGEATEYKATAYQNKLDMSNVDGTLILATDLMLNLAEPEIVPETAMRLRWRGTEYKIQQVWPFAPSGAAIFYLVQVRA